MAKVLISSFNYIKIRHIEKSIFSNCVFIAFVH